MNGPNNLDYSIGKSFRPSVVGLLVDSHVIKNEWTHKTKAFVADKPFWLIALQHSSLLGHSYIMKKWIVETFEWAQ